MATVRLRAAGCIALVASFVLLVLPTTQAHSVTFGPAQTLTLCINPNSSSSWTAYLNSGPADVTWFFRVRIGLNGGDTTQYVRWDWFLIDRTPFAEVAAWRMAVSTWVVTGNPTYVFGETLTVHIGGLLDLTVIIYNNDPQLQCFDLFARSSYVPANSL